MSQTLEWKIGSTERFDEDHIILHWTYLDDLDGPDYDFEGRLEIEVYPFSITQRFSTWANELVEFYDALRALQQQETDAVHLSNQLDDFLLMINRPIDDVYPVRMDLTLAKASYEPLHLSGFAIEKLSLIDITRRIRQFLLETNTLTPI